MATRLLALLVLVCAAYADTGPSLVLRPVRPGQNWNLRAEIQHYLDGAVDVSVGTVDGAWRSEKISVGLTAELLDIGSGGPALPDRIVDTSVAAGFSLGSWEDWDLKAVIGFGSASDRPFNDSRGWYGLATFAAVKEVERGKRWAIVLTYNGNRGFLPHVPLPGVQYERFMGPNFRFVLGLPYNYVYFKPNDRWEFEIAGVPPFGVSARAAYLPAPGWKIFVRYRANRVRGHIDGTASRFSLGYQEQVVELGVLWEPRKNVKATLAGGYGFEREFENESDSGRDFGSIELSDEPYIRFEISVTF